MDYPPPQHIEYRISPEAQAIHDEMHQSFIERMEIHIEAESRSIWPDTDDMTKKAIGLATVGGIMGGLQGAGLGAASSIASDITTHGYEQLRNSYDDGQKYQEKLDREKELQERLNNLK